MCIRDRDIAGDVNAGVGNQAIKNVTELLGESRYNGNGIWLREHANANKLEQLIHIFEKRTLTNIRGQPEDFTYYTIVSQKLALEVRDTHVFRGLNINAHHYMVFSKIESWVNVEKLNIFMEHIVKKLLWYISPWIEYPW